MPRRKKQRKMRAKILKGPTVRKAKTVKMETKVLN